MCFIIGRNLLLLSFSWCLLTCSYCSNTDTILRGQELRDWQKLVSANGVFRLEFFSIDTSKKRYLGISYNEIESPSDNENVVWVANRNNPILDTSGTLTIDSYGNLEILANGSSFIILNPVQPSSNTSATLLDNGNLVLREPNSNGSVGEILWQSFDYPTDTLLPGMKLGINYRTGHTWSLTSWRSKKSPASGSFTFGLDPNRTSQVVILWRDDTYWTSGPWHNGSFEYMSSFSDKSISQFKYFSDENEKYFTFSGNENITQVRYKISPGGYISGSNFAFCLDLNGWYPGDGCTNKKLPDCRKPYYNSESGYMSMRGFVFPESDNLSSFDCQAKCMNDCSCVAFASTNVVEDTGCEIWSQRFVFTSNAWSERIITRLFTETESKNAESKNAASKWWIWLITAAGGALIILLSCSLCYLGWKKQKLQEENKRQQELLLELGAATNPFVRYSTVKKLENDGKKSNELQLFSFRNITTATNNFSIENKLGQGGFGPVYKGKLLDGQEIAIKRLSRSSGQGLIEFKNEIILIAKLQHNNLVRLLGCCIEGEEKMLIYEYLPNKSLDFFLFDPNKRYMLDWKKRYNIIEGIAQGLLYLHKYSRLTVVHRDLKASNILLDDDLNPKISDFGMARIFGRNEFEANTNKIVGTYGYMSPEYAMEGIFSIKSDVFSFGVLLLEIVCSKKNYSSHHHERPLNLIGYAWELWKEGRALEIIDQTLGDLCPNDVLRCIHVGLLCVQENPADRPSMSDVVSMFTNEILQLSAPSQPAFFTGRSPIESGISKNKLENCSVNNASISEMEAR